MYIQQLGEIFPPPSENTLEVCNQITIVIHHYVSSSRVILIKFIDVLKQIPIIFYLTISFKFIN
jgi:hypothetical protein